MFGFGLIAFFIWLWNLREESVAYDSKPKPQRDVPAAQG